jgi:hypothetical protein
MNLVAATAFLLVLAAVGIGIAGAITTFAIVDAINLKLPERDRVEAIGWYPSKTVRVIRTYRELYPGGSLVRRLSILSALAVAWLCIGAITMGFPPFTVACLAAVVAVLVWYVFFRTTAA